MISNAVPSEFVSNVVGYQITPGNFQESTPNLPSRLAIIGEVNTANQGGLTNEPFEFTSAQQIGDKYGYGSPAYMAARIVRPLQGGGIGGIPTVFYPQVEGVVTTKIYTITVTGPATGNKAHFVKIAGRTSLDGDVYAVPVVDGDTDAIVAGKIADAINGVLGSPFTAAAVLGVVTLTSKWGGLTADDLKVEMVDGGDLVGLTYAVLSTQSGSGTPTTINDSLVLFDNIWNTLVLNTYGTNTTVLDILEAFNGIPDPVTPTGRWSATVFKPFVALTGSVADNDSALTDARLDNVTISICPAPLSDGHPLEAASNVALLYARTAQDTPHLDIVNRTYPDMPAPEDGVIGTMSEYVNRDLYVKKGNSTVDLLTGRYRIKDFVTTYHPIGQQIPQFRYVRTIVGIDFNVRFGYFLLEEINVAGKVIAEDNEPIAVTGFIKPKGWKAILFTYATDLAARALTVDAAFMQDETLVGLSVSNPNRLETFFKYKRSGLAYIASTTAEAGFNTGTLN